MNRDCSSCGLQDLLFSFVLMPSQLPSLANPPAPSQNYSIPSVQDMRTHIVVTSPYSLDLNVTHGLIDVALNTAEIMDSL